MNIYLSKETLRESFDKKTPIVVHLENGKDVSISLPDNKLYNLIYRRIAVVYPIDENIYARIQMGNTDEVIE